MIIISQDKRRIINFEQIVEIHVNVRNEIIVETDNLTMTIGRYETEERAKEVLEEIIEIHRVAIPTAEYQIPEE